MQKTLGQTMNDAVLSAKAQDLGHVYNIVCEIKHTLHEIKHSINSVDVL